MKKLLNTLYVTTQGAYLAREGETVQVRIEQDIKLSVPIHTLGGIVCFGRVSCSPPLMGLCAENNVLLSFLSEYGRFIARVQGPVSGNVLLRREQYRRADDLSEAASIARWIVAAKICNCRALLQRVLRDHNRDESRDSLESAVSRLGSLVDRLEEPMPLEEVRGREGEAAAIYFSQFNHAIVAQKESFCFTERSRRPPMDAVNALLSFTYTLLAHDVTGALEGVGLDPGVGFLHRDRPGRPGLALDLMEELRAFIADRLVLSLINRQQVKSRDFKKTESGAVTMSDEARKELLVAYQKRKQEEFTHPFLGEKISVGLLAHIQALLMARFLRGDMDAYPPFFWR